MAPCGGAHQSSVLQGAEGNRGSRTPSCQREVSSHHRRSASALVGACLSPAAPVAAFPLSARSGGFEGCGCWLFEALAPVITIAGPEVTEGFAKTIAPGPVYSGRRRSLACPERDVTEPYIVKVAQGSVVTTATVF